MLNNMYARAGEAFQAGAPLGASWNVAQATASRQQATQAGAAFGLANTAPGMTATNPGFRTAPTTAAQQWATSTDEKATAAVFSFINLLNLPVRKLGDLYETNTRYVSNALNGQANPLKGGLAMVGLAGPAFLAMTSQDYRDEWNSVGEANASPMQTLWLAGKSRIAPDATAPAEDPFRLLDDRSPQARAEYFGSGTAKWVTGVGDLAINLFNDPLIIGGKVAGLVRAGSNTVKATDVAAAASSATNLTRGGRRIDTMVNRVSQAFEDAASEPGMKAALTQMPFIRQSTDAGAITYAMGRLDRIADPAERMAARKELLYAGMGHRPSLAALEAKDRILALEIEDLTGPNREFARMELLLRQDIDHLNNLRAIHEDDWVDRVVDAHMDEIRAQREAFQRVHAVGSPSGLTGDALQATSAVGELAKLPDVMRIGHSIHRGLGVPPVHMLFGRKLPGMFNLSADDAYQSFASAVMRTAGRREAKSAVADKYRTMLDEFSMSYGAPNPAASRATRRQIVDRFNREATEDIVAKYSFGDPQRAQAIRDFILKVRSNRTDEMVNVMERTQRAIDANSDSIHVIDDSGVIQIATADAKAALATPFAGTQLQDLVSIPDYADIERFVKSNFSNGVEGWMRRAADGTWQVTEELLIAGDQLWKFGALFRPGYAVRNLVDNQARNFAMLGVVDSLKNMVRGSANLRYNRGKILASDVERLARISSAQTRITMIDDAIRVAPKSRLTALNLEREQLLEEIARNSEVLGSMTDDVLQTSLRLRQAREELAAMGKPLNAKDRIAQQRLKNQIAEMKAGKSSSYVPRNRTPQARHIGMEGERPAFRDAGEYERFMDTGSAKESVLGLLAPDASRLLGDMRASGQWQSIAPTNPGWSKAYLDIVNNRVRNDAGLMKIIAGADDVTLRNWYLKEPEGQAIWDAIKSRYQSVDELIAVQRQQVDLLLPSGEIRSMAMGGNVTEGMIDDAFRSAEKPAVPMEMLDTASKNPMEALVGYFNRTRAFWFKWAGEIPETTLGRLPFYVNRKQGHLNRLWPVDDAGNAVTLTKQQVDELYKRADILAKRDVGNYLFDTSQRSNLSAHLKFFSPFYNAWSDTMRKWTRIAGYNPAVIPLGAKAFMAPNSMFTVVDNEGNQILVNGDVVDANGDVIRRSSDPTEGYIVLPLPSFIAKWAGSDDSVRMAKSALNVTFQGEPFWLPSTGPIVTIPANYAATHYFPDLVDNPVGRYLLPYGPEPDSASMALPMWVRNARSLFNAQVGDYSESRLAQTFGLMLASKAGEIERGEAAPMTQGELLDYAGTSTRNWWIMRFFSNWTGFTVQPNSKLDFYVNEYRRYRREYGADAIDKFYEDYPDYFEATISLSTNETGIAATDDTWDASQRYRSDITHNPEWGWMYVGAANLTAGFSEGVYTAQQVAGWRQVKNPVEAYEDTRVASGWKSYQRFSDALNRELEARAAAGGPVSITANANADLKQIRDQFMGELKADNPEWASVFDRGGTASSIGEFFRAAATAVEDNPELANRSDFVSLDQYLRVREEVRMELDARGLATIDSPGAEDLAEIWAQFTTDLVASDLGFEQMWSRGGLDRDKVARGVVNGG